MLDSQDLIIRQIQQFIAALLKRSVELMQVPTLDELSMILEELSGLSMDELQRMPEATLIYLLKLRTSGELRSSLAQALRLQEGDRWGRVAAALEAED